MSYYFAKTLALNFEDAVRRTTEALKTEGFGIITEINVKDTLKKKIDVDFRNYCILGAGAIPLRDFSQKSLFCFKWI